MQRRTPFMSGMSDAGSVDMLASSMNTMGKSTLFSESDADVIQVVQT